MKDKEKVINTIRRRTAIAAAAAGVAAVMVQTGSEAFRTGDPEKTGIAIPGVRLLYDPPAVQASRLDRVAAAGVRWLRFDATWPEIEYVRGRYDFAAVDRAVNAARARGLRVVLILAGSAPWARPAGTDGNHGPGDDRARAGFAAFATAAATRYRGRVGTYEIWNEPNLPGSWAPRPDPAAYLDLLAGAYAAIHHADPGAVVLSGGSGGGPSGIDSIRWHQALLRGGLAGISDAVAVHPYPDAGRWAGSGEMARARTIRELMDLHGAGHVALWGTETGIPTGGAHAVSEQRQGQLVEGLAHAWRDLHHTGPLFFYTLMDFGGTDREDHFGLLHTDGSPKPAYYALRDRVVAD